LLGLGDLFLVTGGVSELIYLATVLRLYPVFLEISLMLNPCSCSSLNIRKSSNFSINTAFDSKIKSCGGGHFYPAEIEHF
jgi:hypothetical protein